MASKIGGCHETACFTSGVYGLRVLVELWAEGPGRAQLRLREARGAATSIKGTILAPTQACGSVNTQNQYPEER
jgi:hypothetical protein